MFDDILGVGLSAISGGAVGLIGAGVKMLFGWLAEREKRAQRREEMAHELAVRKMELDAADKNADRDYRKDVEVAAEATRQASYTFANITGPVWVWAASVVSLMRPIITVYLMVAVSYVAWRLLGGEPLPYVDTPRYLGEIINGLVFLTTTAVTWWFGDRPPQSRR